MWTEHFRLVDKDKKTEYCNYQVAIFCCGFPYIPYIYSAAFKHCVLPLPEVGQSEERRPKKGPV